MSDEKKQPYLGNFGSREWQDRVRNENDSQKEEVQEEEVLENATQEIVETNEISLNTTEKSDDIPSVEELRKRERDARNPNNSNSSNAVYESLDDAKKRKRSEPLRADDPKCKRLKDKDTTFVFVYGDAQSGKTCFLVSLINHLRTDIDGRLEARRTSNQKEAIKLLRNVEIDFNDKREVPRPSSTNKAYELDFIYTPKNSKIPAKFTFLEMSGENLNRIHIGGKAYDQLPDFIDVYLNCPAVNLCFVMIVPHNADITEDKNWGEIDFGLLDFIDYIKKKNPNHDHAKMLCLISKWDSYKGDCQTVTEFMKRNLPRTYRQLEARNNQISSYSIGQVVKARDKQGRIIDYITAIDNTAANKVKHWLYQAVTSRNIPTDNWLQRLAKLFN